MSLHTKKQLGLEKKNRFWIWFDPICPFCFKKVLICPILPKLWIGCGGWFIVKRRKKLLKKTAPKEGNLKRYFLPICIFFSFFMALFSPIQDLATSQLQRKILQLICFIGLLCFQTFNKTIMRLWGLLIRQRKSIQKYNQQ